MDADQGVRASLAQLARRGPCIMGILNVTPDSFSDGGRFADLETAVAQGVRMADDGAAVIDVGGESTRPGSQPVPAAEQRRRVVEVIARLRRRLPAMQISIDTTSADVAAAALDAGADVINDISAGRDDTDMLALAARRGVPLVLMHMQGRPATMQNDPRYQNVVEEVREFLAERIAAAVAAGISREQLIVDPGIGFGKAREHNVALLAGLERLTQLHCPLLLGVSRKAFLGHKLPTQEPRQLVAATCATTALGVMAGARIFRVHDVAENRQAMDVAWQWQQARKA